MKMARSLVIRASSVAFAAAVAVACGGSSSSSSSAGGGSGGAADAPSFVSSYCAIMAPCCATVSKPTDGAQCRAFVTALTGISKYDAAKGSACISEMNAAKDTAGFCQGTSTANLADCKGAFSTTGGGGGGTKNPGDPCTSPSECASSAEGKVDCQTYFGTAGAETKICQVQIPGKVGDTPCIGTTDGGVTSFEVGGPPIARGYICDRAAGARCETGKACVALVPAGGDCTSSTECTGDAYCDFTSHKCAARVADGAPCAGNNQACQAASYCDTASSTCAAAIADGQPCAAPKPCASGICVNGQCGTSGGGGGLLGLAFLCGS
jgi:Dickkopf N-terminal cysteine-rich region